MSAARAELLADGGARASSDRDFFRSPEFLDAEGVSHTVVLAGAAGEVAIPLVVREIPRSDRCDAISPYGYPGARVSKAPPEDVDWSGTGLVSLFLRDRIGGEPCLGSPTERSDVQLHDPAQPRQVRGRLAEQVRGNARAGWAVERVAGPSASAAERSAFAAAYGETMARVGAAERYLYPGAYFERILGFEHSHLLLARSPAGGLEAGAIAAVSDGLLHYYLGGTAEVAIEASPFKNVVWAMLDLADELGLPLNLGGGVEPGDGLERFKRGFANATAPFRTHEVVADASAYGELAAGRDARGYFPAYRAPNRGSG
jgi:hypothetical protein